MPILFRIVFFLCLLLPASGIKAQEQPLRLVTEDLYPLSYIDEETGQIAGVAVDMAKTAMAASGIDYELSLLSWPEAYSEAINTPGTVIFSMARTPNREDRFVWVHKINDFNYALYAYDISLADEPVEVIRTLPTSVTRNELSHYVLEKNGFTNLIFVNENTRAYELYYRGLLDLVFINENYKTHNEDNYPSPLYKLKNVELEDATFGMYFAANLETSPQLIERLRSAFATHIDAGMYERLLAPYTAKLNAE